MTEEEKKHKEKIAKMTPQEQANMFGQLFVDNLNREAMKNPNEDENIDPESLPEPPEDFDILPGEATQKQKKPS